MPRTLPAAAVLLLAAALPAGAAAPDLVAKDLTLDAGRRLVFTLANEGDAAVPPGAGVHVFIDGRLMTMYDLDTLTDQSFREPGGVTRVDTGWRLTGSHRRAAVSVDPRREIAESNEHQNTVSRTLMPPAVVAADLVISDLYVEAGTLRIQVRNDGTAMVLAGASATFRVSLDGATVATFDALLPLMGPGWTRVVVPPVAIPVPLDAPVRVSALVTAARGSDDADNTNNLRHETMPFESHPDPYGLLFEPRIRAAVKWEDAAGVRSLADWTLAERFELNAAIARLENRQPSLPLEPPALLPGNAISAADAWNIFLSHVAHAVWVENHRKVPWHLTSFTDDQLAFLFDGRKLLRYRGAGRYAFESRLMGNVTAWNPRIAYEFMDTLGLLRATQRQTIYALTDWMRAHLVHTTSGDDFTDLFGYAGPPPAERILYPLPGRRHKTAGCWGTSGLYAAVLRGVNLPVERADTVFGDGGVHARPVFPSVGLSLVHGDDPYNAMLGTSGAVVPASRLFYSLATMTTRFLAPAVLDCGASGCNTAGEQAAVNKSRDHLNAAYSYLTDYLLDDYATYGPAHLDDTFRGSRIGGEVVEYARPFFTAEERAARVAAVEARLREIGGGDLEAGKRIVQGRKARYGSNR